MEDYSESRRAGERLAAGHGVDDPFAAAISATRMAMIVADATQPDIPIIFANDAFLRLTGYARDEVIGRNCRFLQGPDTDPKAIQAVRDALAAGEDVAVDLLNYRKDGSPFWNALNMSPVRNDAGQLVYFFGSQVDVTDKKVVELRARDHSDGLQQMVEERTRELTEALKQKTALLHEVDHRVKNNLQLISSLLLLQNRRVPDPAVKASLRGMLGRVNAIATVHRRLFQSEDVERFDVSAFIRDMVADLMGSAMRDDIRVELDLERVEIPAAKAAPLALVVNELLTNALRHGFPEGRGGRIFVGLSRLNGDFRIEITDDGVGQDRETRASGFGLTIVQLLCQQLKAKWETTDAEPGTRVVVLLPINGTQ
ncbi:PAS domain-containing protein [Caulobacter vibrioides]|uniref:LOV histidine kinase LovK n=2 Tax=Caulobacter vibrioides TaxID=155892 RepID=Q9ABE3_CAUVC|nr:photosensory histidine protein kinase LovK [Caulobacter vibrioides]YP_002515662.1 photosensory histidine protein kinase LovK [Caulobacter vibrioides NA1000]AAK22272.2 LOV histidine kinase LovK [Caulobacter vibrioides CB15]ACL93754.1 photosensory histidine protein kinase LovK [Caulobacter vibrioides NA1000]ATC23290.1 histidine kinase [Caulobacter vibrioides]ATC27116.1 histidine kinase [Caulobacter vibrioides]AZH11501.1 PAS domain-containing protein [Caulobacter vibrioides]